MFSTLIQIELEGEDSVASQDGLIGTKTGNPLVTYFRSHCDVGMNKPVQATGDFVAALATALPPFDASASFPAVVEIVEEILVDTNLVDTAVGLDQVTLQDVLKLTAELSIDYDTVAVTVASPSQVTESGDVGERSVIVNVITETAKEAATVSELIETGVPTEGPSSVDV